ncbi:MAG: VWA domain-containing protein, partial [Deltaproteobacteria bacterium]|nr:VWA domain-containing protein [Deltaproteobacteria bacterium]MBW2535862.1 VWA domain-containing protein [Deltaproteobacteria bacterium]
MRRIGLWFLGLLAAGAMASMPIACGATDGSNAFNDDDDDGTGLAGTGTGGTGAGGGAAGLDFDAGKGDGNLSDGEICEGVEETAQPLPLHMILLIDRSGSMATYGYWAPLQQALIQFIQDPLSDGLYVGLNYFPAPAGGDSCSVGYWNPIQVPAGAPPLALLPQDATTLVNNINSTSTGNMTPMYGGLAGSYQVANTLRTTYPNDKVIVVLASDGLPN